MFCMLQMREFSMKLRGMVAKHTSDEDIDKEIHAMREQVIRIKSVINNRYVQLLQPFTCFACIITCYCSSLSLEV